MSILELKLEFLGFVIVMSFCIFSCLKWIKEIGGFRELYQTLCEREG